MKHPKLSRRQLVQGLGASAVGGALLGPVLAPRRARAEPTEPAPDPYFLIVIGATGGASIVDSFMAVRHGECASFETLNTFPDATVQSVTNTPFRAVNTSMDSVGPIPLPFSSDQVRFVQRNSADMMVVPYTGTSVNHRVGQKRTITGNDAWHGRTLQEAVAMQYGRAFPLPNVNMSFDGYFERGSDRSVDEWAYHVPVTDAPTWPLGLDGARGVRDLPSRALINEVRGIRNQVTDANSIFGRTFRSSERLRRWNSDRDRAQRLEQADLITRLMMLQNGPTTPLTQYGLAESPDGARIRERFPRFMVDSLSAKAALAFLLLKHRVSCTVTLSPTFATAVDQQAMFLSNAPLAFDFSHNVHRATQALMWSRILDVVDGLASLLRDEPFDEARGISFWDRTLIYVATEFGRDRRRPSSNGDFSTGHDLNNGVLIVSPLANGNRVLGGINPQTVLTYGCDMQTGVPSPDVENQEREIYAGILHALRVDTTGSGLPDVRAMRRTA
jgi:hypothetical protein